MRSYPQRPCQKLEIQILHTFQWFELCLFIQSAVQLGKFDPKAANLAAL